MRSMTGCPNGCARPISPDLVINGRLISVLGNAPKRVGITEYSSAEKARAWVDSPERKALAPSRDKAINFTRQYIVEGN